MDQRVRYVITHNEIEPVFFLPCFCSDEWWGKENLYNFKIAAVDSKTLLQKALLEQGGRSIAASPILETIQYTDRWFDAWEDKFLSLGFDESSLS
jgi:hypothetical protein